MIYIRLVDKIIVILESNEPYVLFNDFKITFDSTSDEILNAVQPAILGKFGVNISESQGENGYVYIVRKVQNSGNMYVWLKSSVDSLILKRGEFIDEGTKIDKNCKITINL